MHAQLRAAAHAEEQHPRREHPRVAGASQIPIHTHTRQHVSKRRPTTTLDTVSRLSPPPPPPPLVRLVKGEKSQKRMKSTRGCYTSRVESRGASIHTSTTIKAALTRLFLSRSRPIKNTYFPRLSHKWSGENNVLCVNRRSWTVFLAVSSGRAMATRVDPRTTSARLAPGGLIHIPSLTHHTCIRSTYEVG